MRAYWWYCYAWAILNCIDLPMRSLSCVSRCSCCVLCAVCCNPSKSKHGSDLVLGDRSRWAWVTACTTITWDVSIGGDISIVCMVCKCWFRFYLPCVNSLVEAARCIQRRRYQHRLQGMSVLVSLLPLLRVLPCVEGDDISIDCMVCQYYFRIYLLGV